MKFSRKVGNGSVNKRLNFGGDPDHRLDTGIVFWIRHYWEIRKVVSTDCAVRRCSARHALAGIAVRHSNYDVITSPVHNRQQRQTCLGGGMHWPSASCFTCNVLTVWPFSLGIDKLPGISTTVRDTHEYSTCHAHKCHWYTTIKAHCACLAVTS